jgi:hypothetical protein
MAVKLHYNLSGEFATELVKVGDSVKVGSARFCNVHATLPCFIDMYIKKETVGTYYLLKNTKLPAGASLETSGFSASGMVNGFNLYVKLTQSASEIPVVDVILR